MWISDINCTCRTLFNDFTYSTVRNSHQMAVIYSISLFTALVIDSFIVQHKGMQGFELNIPFIVATIPTVIIAVVTRSLTITIIVGIIFIAGIRWFF